MNKSVFALTAITMASLGCTAIAVEKHHAVSDEVVAEQRSGTGAEDLEGEGGGDGG